MNEEFNDPQSSAATGLAGLLIAGETLKLLIEKGIITKAEADTILARAAKMAETVLVALNGFDAATNILNLNARTAKI